MNFKRRAGNSEVGFQMGPMLDIIFILLIQFMVATMFANRENWFKINVPVAANGSDSQDQVAEILLNLRENGELYLDKGFSDSEGTSSKGEAVIKVEDWDENDQLKPGWGQARLKSELERFHLHNRSLKVIIRADAQTAHGKVVSILDICAELSIRNVAFATQKRMAGEAGK